MPNSHFLPHRRPALTHFAQACSARTLGLSVLLGLACSLAHAQVVPALQASNAATPSPELLSFKEFFQFPVGPRGLDIHPRLQQANGQAVRLRGYMVQQDHGSQRGQFFFTPRPVQMSEHADGDADDLPPATVLVKLAPAQSTWVVPHTAGLIELAGTLSVGRQEADDGRVTWVQLQLQH